MKNIFSIIVNIIIGLFKIVMRILNDYRVHFNDYSLHVVALFMFVFGTEAVMPNIIRVFNYPGRVLPGIEKNEIRKLPSQKVYNGDEWVVEIAIDRKNTHRVSIADLRYHYGSDSNSFDGTNYSNNGDIYGVWNSDCVKDANNGTLTYSYRCAYNNKVASIGSGELHYSKIRNFFPIGSFNDDGEKTIYANYYKLSDVEDAVKYNFNANDRGVVKEFIRRVISVY